ncbi:hypothetical protein DPMN_073590, partial [Dreissena polymorpha]
MLRFEVIVTDCVLPALALVFSLERVKSTGHWRSSSYQADQGPGAGAPNVSLPMSLHGANPRTRLIFKSDRIIQITKKALANSVDPAETPHDAASHQHLHCLREGIS